MTSIRSLYRPFAVSGESALVHTPIREEDEGVNSRVPDPNCWFGRIRAPNPRPPLDRRGSAPTSPRRPEWDPI